jgi:amino acid transporter
LANVAVPSRPSPPLTPQLRRTLGLVQLTVSGLAIIIGAGIYVLIGDAAAQAGNMLWLSLVLAATIGALLWWIRLCSGSREVVPP